VPLLAVDFLLAPLQALSGAFHALAIGQTGGVSPSASATKKTCPKQSSPRTRRVALSQRLWQISAAFLSVPGISFKNDLFRDVTSAMARFRTMNSVDQARVLHHHADPFEGLVVDYVRAAADSVVSLVPMMKGVRIDTIEDDLTAFIQQLLAARVHFLGWSLSDQSKGGFTPKGNPGERDLLLM
jgi:hypothetical protein